MNFERLYHEHKNKVYNLALHYMQNREDAEEVTQDVFIAVHNSLNDFEHRSSLSTWIYRITINKSLDALKARKRKKRFALFVKIFQPGQDPLDHFHFTTDHPGLQMEQRESLQRIFEEIDTLPDQQKTAIILSKIEHKSQAEVAEIMGISAKAVESLVQRAKTNLNKKLNPGEGTTE